jgi:hypothetical protein
MSGTHKNLRRELDLWVAAILRLEIRQGEKQSFDVNSCSLVDNVQVKCRHWRALKNSRNATDYDALHIALRQCREQSLKVRTLLHSSAARSNQRRTEAPRVALSE